MAKPESQPGKRPPRRWVCCLSMIQVICHTHSFFFPILSDIQEPVNLHSPVPILKGDRTSRRPLLRTMHIWTDSYSSYLCDHWPQRKPQSRQRGHLLEYLSSPQTNHPIRQPPVNREQFLKVFLVIVPVLSWDPALFLLQGSTPCCSPCVMDKFSFFT